MNQNIKMIIKKLNKNISNKKYFIEENNNDIIKYKKTVYFKFITLINN